MSLISVSFANNQMAHGGSGLIDVYNADQKKVISSFGKLDKNTLYLFFVENVKGKDGDIAGYMPLQYQCGFIYDNPNPSIIAHELGHGAFNLRHTFSNERFIAAQGKTPNLMDYAGGTELWKYQWGEIQDPQRMWFAFLEDESESEARVVLKEDKGSYNIAGSDQILWYLLNKKAKTVMQELSIYNYSLDNENAPKASYIISNALGGKIIIGDPNEALFIVHNFINIYKYKLVEQKHDEIVSLIVNSSSFPEEQVKKSLSNALGFIALTSGIIEESQAYYKNLYTFYNSAAKIEVTSFRESLLVEHATTYFTNIGRREAFAGLSNTQFKSLIKSKIPTISGTDMQELLRLKATPTLVASEKYSEMLAKCSTKEVLKQIDDITLMSLRNSRNFASTSLSNQALNTFQYVGNLAAFTQLLNILKNEEEITPTDVLMAFPSVSLSIGALLAKLIVEGQIQSTNEVIWETAPSWNLVENWNRIWRGQKGMPDEPLYMYYTDQNTKCNPSMTPTSIIFQDKNKAAEVFGFTPTHVDFDNQGQMKSRDKNIFFLPTRQVAYEK